MYLCPERRKVRVTVYVYICNCFRSVCFIWDDDEGKAHSLLLFISSKGTARFNAPHLTDESLINSTICLLSMYCGRVWNLIQALDAQSGD